MGCDIHAYVEVRSADSTYWQSFGQRVNLGRCYDTFGRMAGVRGGPALVKPRGLPEDVGFDAHADYWLRITPDGGDGSATPEDAARWVKSGISIYRRGEGAPQFVSDPHSHSHSWLSLAEFSAAVGTNGESEYRALLAVMRSLEGDGKATRVVFWFDS